MLTRSRNWPIHGTLLYKYNSRCCYNIGFHGPSQALPCVAPRSWFQILLLHWILIQNDFAYSVYAIGWWYILQQIGARPGGRWDMRTSWIITDRRLLQQQSPAVADKPARRESMQNCSNSTCFVSFHRIPFRWISNYRCIASRGMFGL